MDPNDLPIDAFGDSEKGTLSSSDKGIFSDEVEDLAGIDDEKAPTL
jgi:hypothetical protein